MRVTQYMYKYTHIDRMCVLVAGRLGVKPERMQIDCILLVVTSGADSRV